MAELSVAFYEFLGSVDTDQVRERAWINTAAGHLTVALVFYILGLCRVLAHVPVRV